MVTISPHSSDEQDSGTAWSFTEASQECDAEIILYYGGRTYVCSENIYDHPLGSSISAHEAVGWSAPDKRNTMDRCPVTTLGHVGVHWSGPSPMGVRCGGGWCQLATIR